jgi:WD40 repeat protein
MLAIGVYPKHWTTLDLETGVVGPIVKVPFSWLAWHPNGRELAVSTGKTYAIEIFDATTGRQVGSGMPGAHSTGLAEWYNHRGDLLVSNDWSGIRRLWDPDTGYELLKIRASDAYSFAFGRTDDEAAVSILLRVLQI